MLSVKTFLQGLAAIAAASLATAQAAVINPATGLSGNVTVTTTTPETGVFKAVDTVAGMAGNTATITVATASFIDFSIADAGIMGDAYALQLDGVTLTPDGGNMGADARGPAATSFFSMFINTIFLSAGLHTFGIFYTDACCNIGISLNEFEFSAARPVPVPGAIPLFLAGLAGLVFARRQRKT